MENGKFIITEYNTPFRAIDTKGKKVEFECRHSSCFIVTFSGKIKFTTDDTVLFSDKDHSVFLPEGLKYTNECIEDAESIVFNFKTLEKFSKPLSLAASSEDFAREKCKSIKSASLLGEPLSHILALKELYSLSCELFSQNMEDKNTSNAEKTVEKAIEFMLKSYKKSDLSSHDIASACFISEIYLRKLFLKHLDTTPYKKLTEIRMNRALLLLLEKRSVSEVAESVGFSDIYSFSRAFKRYYGKSPSKYCY
ncbi:MAG: helix-turn-helix transcriptional regulator [Clostridia bacterium]|nr:helix-turn-helix transcriptional regulator [Clostridia bacterium]